MDIKITVKRKLPICGDVAIVCNNSDYTVIWELDEEWSGYDTKTMRTAYQDGTYTDTVFTGNTVALPVVTVPGTVKIGLYAGDIRTSRPALIRALDSITSDGGTPAAPSEDVYNQLMERMAQLETPDWAQNDPDAKDYVKNRPGGYLTTMQKSISLSAGLYVDSTESATVKLFPPFAIGEKITVTVNGADYTTVARDDGYGGAVIGGDYDKGDADAYGWAIYSYQVDGEAVVAFDNFGRTHKTFAFTYRGIVPFPLETLPDGVIMGIEAIYSTRKLFDVSMIPTDSDVFGNPISAGGAASTLDNPYPNKQDLFLSPDDFDLLLNGTEWCPPFVRIGGSFAAVNAMPEKRVISVSWCAAQPYGINGHEFYGASLSVYCAKIHEDDNNPGTIVSEYGYVTLADKKLE